MSGTPDWLDPGHWAVYANQVDTRTADLALNSERPGVREFAALISPAAAPLLESMAARARTLTIRHFGRTTNLYVPLYLSNHCPGGCVYCGFSSDRKQTQRRLEPDALKQELQSLRTMGFQDVLLLTGERTAQADFSFVRDSVAAAAGVFHRVGIETFAMQSDEYRSIADAGCSYVTLYQETYNPERYAEMHRSGEKRDYAFRIAAPDRILSAGMHAVGIGALLGLDEPVREMIALYQHADYLKRRHWRGGISISFPRIRPESGGFQPAFPVDDHRFAQIIFAFRIAFPDVPLVISTRESATFRDGIAGLGINRMSAASRTTVGGYTPGEHDTTDAAQFDINDERSVEQVCSALRQKGLEPVFKNWDAALAASTPNAKH